MGETLLMTIDTVPKLDVFELSHVGKVREDNQDSVRVCDPNDPINASCGYVYGIADGMGGYSHGGVASALALTTFFESFYRSTGNQIPQNMRKAVQDANLIVYQTSQRMGMVRMGTTLTAVNVVGDRLHLAHIGDSRAYLIRDGKASCITNDHTMVGDLVRMKVLSPDKVRTHAQRSTLNKCLGIDLFVQPDITQVPLMPDDVIILCTDGIWSVIQDEEFADLTLNTASISKLPQQLIDLAMERDSDDNVSAVVIYAESLPEASIDSSTKRSLGLPKFIRSRFSAKF